MPGFFENVIAPFQAVYYIVTMGNASSMNLDHEGETGSLLYQRDRDIVFGHMKKAYQQQKRSEHKASVVFGFLCLNQYEVLINVKGAKRSKRIQIEAQCFDEILSLILLYYSEGEHPKNTVNHRKQRENSKECLLVESLYDEIYDDVMMKVEREASTSPMPPLQLSRIERNEYMQQKWERNENERECSVVETLYEEIFDEMMEIEIDSSMDDKRERFNECIEDSLSIQLHNEGEESTGMDGFVAYDDGFFLSTEYSPEFAKSPRDHHKSRRFDPVYYENDECSVI